MTWKSNKVIHASVINECIDWFMQSIFGFQCRMKTGIAEVLNSVVRKQSPAGFCSCQLISWLNYTWEARWMLLTPINWADGRPAVVLSVELSIKAEVNVVMRLRWFFTFSEKRKDLVFGHGLRKVSSRLDGSTEGRIFCFGASSSRLHPADSGNDPPIKSGFLYLEMRSQCVLFWLQVANLPHKTFFKTIWSVLICIMVTDTANLI